MSYAVVSGANRGLGLEFVRQLLDRGQRVIAGCRKPAQAQKLNAFSALYPGHLKVLPLDVASEKSIVEFVREIGMFDAQVNLLINNAGVLVSGERLGDLATKSLLDSFSTNAIGPLLLTEALLPRILSGAHSRIVNISSQLGSIGGTHAFHTISYGMSKAALNMATRQLAAELAPSGIIVVCMHPGWVQTEMGGVNAPLDIAPAVRALLDRIEALTIADAGRFLGADGKDLPW